MFAGVIVRKTQEHGGIIKHRSRGDVDHALPPGPPPPYSAERAASWGSYFAERLPKKETAVVATTAAAIGCSLALEGPLGWKDILSAGTGVVGGVVDKVLTRKPKVSKFDEKAVLASYYAFMHNQAITTTHAKQMAFEAEERAKEREHEMAELERKTALLRLTGRLQPIVAAIGQTTTWPLPRLKAKSPARADSALRSRISALLPAHGAEPSITNSDVLIGVPTVAFCVRGTFRSLLFKVRRLPSPSRIACGGRARKEHIDQKDAGSTRAEARAKGESAARLAQMGRWLFGILALIWRRGGRVQVAFASTKGAFGLAAGRGFWWVAINVLKEQADIATYKADFLDPPGLPQAPPAPPAPLQTSPPPPPPLPDW
ncbi:uncharacterized protein EV422DRAFT_570445 [Fimicolochytrium jonesii]|uniref:uncharacterized protein n=1 Tax=Fimicolochytrium jonesii TaxID=1396493 RepID=UPI0022FEF129|nr:uncharacterized protein EV422DRAFT_570445 [Fimicolochytrium jonesii]KAI8817677.1 hypothetical protein EV422DRAFT_570445 [Fimicolochytrium jonesii]